MAESASASNVNKEEETQNASTAELCAGAEKKKIVVKEYPKKLSRKSTSITVKGTMPKSRHELIRWDGWGYKDSGFSISNEMPTFTGNRYPISGKNLPYLRPYLYEKFSVVPESQMPLKHQLPRDEDYPKSMFTESILDSIRELGVEVITEGVYRLERSRGQSLEDIYLLINDIIHRIPDAVAWPTCHEDVVEIIKIADRLNFVIIPYGGGTSVTRALDCPKNELRPILSLDMSLMNEILWVDKQSLVICAESGIIGQDLERELNKIGYTTGHDPDSNEFSTLGGWVSTRASGMKKNMYGNIEDLLVHVRLVTPRGVLEKGTRAPRISSGPDFNHIVLGSEGLFGVITEVCLKIRELPEAVRYGSYLFSDFECGITFMHEVARRRWQPASLRLMDHEQFQLGLALRPPGSLFSSAIDGVKFGYLSMVKGMDLNKVCLTTVTFEGDKKEVLMHEKKLNALAVNYKGMIAGEENGKRGYMMTFVVAYIRDIAIDLNILGDSMETAVPWCSIVQAQRAVRNRIQVECDALQTRAVSMLRIAQTYETGCCLYVYFSFVALPGLDIISTSNAIEEAIREEVVAHGGSVSHHHGIGKHKREWYEKMVSPAGSNFMRAAKAHMDPNNIFGSGNILTDLSVRSSKL